MTLKFLHNGKLTTHNHYHYKLILLFLKGRLQILINKAKENIASFKKMGNQWSYPEDKTKCKQESKSLESNVPTNPEIEETECEQRKESKVDDTVDGTECTPKTTTSNLNDLEEDVKGGILGVKVRHAHKPHTHTPTI